MNIVRFEPWKLADLLHRDLGRVALRRFAVDADTDAQWVPAVDIVEEKDRFVLRADVPGVDPADIDVSMDNGVLTVAGERQAQRGSEDASLQRAERAKGRFSRRFSLPDTTDAEGITAQSRNGMLEISIPKLPEVQARRISVEAA
jgi:HSP20 family protein